MISEGRKNIKFYTMIERLYILVFIYCQIQGILRINWLQWIYRNCMLKLNKLVLMKFCAQIHWVQSKRHRLWFSTKTCSCYSTKTYVNNVILILKLSLTSMGNIYIKRCVVLNEDHFKCMFFIQVKFNSKMRITRFTQVFVE